MALGRPKTALVLDAKTNLEIAQQLEMTNATVGKWRRRFPDQRISGLASTLRTDYTGLD